MLTCLCASLLESALQFSQLAYLLLCLSCFPCLSLLGRGVPCHSALYVLLLQEHGTCRIPG